MTDEERWKIQGRTFESLKRSKETVAVLAADLRDHVQKLKEASESLAHFITEPSGAGPTGMTRVEYLLHFHRDLISPDIQAKLREYAVGFERVKELQQQVDRF